MAGALGVAHKLIVNAAVGFTLKLQYSGLVNIHKEVMQVNNKLVQVTCCIAVALI